MTQRTPMRISLAFWIGIAALSVAACKKSPPPGPGPLAAAAAAPAVSVRFVKVESRRLPPVLEISGTLEAGQVVSNEMWRPGPDGSAVPASPPTPELADSLERFGFNAAEHAAAEGWWR